MNEACKTWMEKRRCLLKDFLWHKSTENLIITKFPMITKFPNAISSGKILTLIFSFLAKTYESHTQFYKTGMTHTNTLTRTYTHLPLCHGHTLSIVTDTHQHIDRGFYTYMTSYFVQSYRLPILIHKTTLFIDSWLIRLWVDNVLFINTRSLSILIDTSIPTINRNP